MANKRSLNRVILVGNVGRDPEIKYVDQDVPFARFTLATSESYRSKNGEKIETTEWHNIVLRNQPAEICEKYLKKGDKVYVEGRLKNRQWQGEDGNMRYTTEIHVTDFTFLSNKN